VDYKKAYDDPYRVLAAYIVSNGSPRALSRIMNESAFIKALVVKEAKQLDMGGCFLDCIDQEIIARASFARRTII
jgi:hypothetical protein